MVRLVFRPYAQIRRSICTSEPLRPSTRVSSGFSLFRHSSPSFGSQRARSCSTSPTRRVKSAGDAPPSRADLASFCFHCALGFRTAQRLARALDSLVRVSRRVGEVTDSSRRPRASGESAPSRQATLEQALRAVPEPGYRRARAPRPASRRTRNLSSAVEPKTATRLNTRIELPCTPPKSAQQPVAALAER